MMRKRLLGIGVFFLILHSDCCSIDRTYNFCKKMVGSCLVFHLPDVVKSPDWIIQYVVSFFIKKQKQQQQQKDFFVVEHQLLQRKKVRESLFKRRKVDLADAPFLILDDEKMEGVIYTAEDMYTPAPLHIPNSDYRYAAPAFFKSNGKEYQHIVVCDDANNEFLQTVQIIE